MSAKVSLSLATLVLCTLSAMGTAQISYQVTDIKVSDTWRLMFLFTLGSGRTASFRIWALSAGTIAPPPH